MTMTRLPRRSQPVSSAFRRAVRDSASDVSAIMRRASRLEKQHATPPHFDLLGPGLACARNSCPTTRTGGRAGPLGFARLSCLRRDMPLRASDIPNWPSSNQRKRRLVLGLWLKSAPVAWALSTWPRPRNSGRGTQHVLPTIRSSGTSEANQVSGRWLCPVTNGSEDTQQK